MRTPPLLRSVVIHGVDAHIDHRCPRLDPVRLHHLRATCGTDNDVRLPHLSLGGIMRRGKRGCRQYTCLWRSSGFCFLRCCIGSSGRILLDATSHNGVQICDATHQRTGSTTSTQKIKRAAKTTMSASLTCCWEALCGAGTGGAVPLTESNKCFK